MKFKKIYIEVTNTCNFNCSFCLKTNRAKRFMSAEEFDFITSKIANFTNYIYLHVLGEPMLHPRFLELLNIAKAKGLKINLTTNASLLGKIAVPQNLLNQVNISLHSLPDNMAREKWDSYFEDVFSFIDFHSRYTYISMRLWNAGADDVSEFNSLCLNKINAHFQTNFDGSVFQIRNTKIAPHVFLQNSARFSWPNQKALNKEKSEGKRCLGLSDHIAILSNGDVVPCCLDADDTMTLGNIFNEELENILATEKAVFIKQSLSKGVSPTESCKNCGFIMP